MAMNGKVEDKKLFAFDLDGTLARSKTSMDKEMDALLTELLSKRLVAVIGGGSYAVFTRQLLDNLSASEELLANLHLMPTSSSMHLVRKEGEWVPQYELALTTEERKRIIVAFEDAFEAVGYKHPDTLYGEVIEDRGTQITFSALGQEAPIDLKDAWKGSEHDRRFEIVEAMKPMLPEFEIKIPGKTSIDVTRKGIDKGYGIEQLVKELGIPVEQMVFVGDALYEGGNDEPVKRTGIEAIPVESPEDTKVLLRQWLNEL